MIALQTRGAKLPDPAAQTAKFVSMMNMTRQQEAAERQAALAQQQMGINLAREDRDVETQTATMRDKDAEFQDKELKRLGRVGVAVLRTEDPTLREAAYQTLLGEVEKADPRLGATMRQVAPTFNAAVVESAVMEVDKYFNAKYPNATYSNEIADAGGFDAQGRPIPAGTLLQVRNSVVPEVAPIPSATAARTATPVPTAAPQQTTSSPVPVGKYGETRFAPDGGPLTPDLQESLRKMKEGLGMTNTPASFNSGSMSTPTAGQMTPDMVPAILDSAVKTGVMAQIDLDQMIALAPPQARDGIMQVIRGSKIALQADAPSLAASGMGQQPMAPNPVQRPQSQFADMRGPAPQASFADLGGQPPMQNTMAQYQPVQRRDPNMSPIPGSSRVPLSRVGDEARVQRTTPAEDAAKETAKLQAAEDFEARNKDVRIGRKREEVFAAERAKKDSDFLETYTDITSKSRTGLNVLDQMIGDARIEKGRIVIPKGGRAPHPGFEGVVGLGFPGVRFIQGTEAANFDGLLEQIKSTAFLKAFSDLRGGGSITVVEGDKATAALTRMSRAQSEIEFVRAAQEFRTALRTGVAQADKRYTRLTGEAPPAAPAPRRRTPTKGSDGWGKAKVVGN